MNPINPSKKIFRGISVEEFDDLIDNKEFRIGRNSLEAKQFCYSIEEAKRFIEASDFLEGEQAIMSLEIPESFDKGLDFSTDIDPEIFTSGVLTVQRDKLTALNEEMNKDIWNLLDLEDVIIVE